VTGDVQSLQELLTTGSLQILAEIISVVIVLVILLSQDVILTMATMVSVPLLLTGMLIWQKHARVAFVQVRQAISGVNTTINENVSGVRVIQSLGREDENAKRFDEVNRQNF